jgi:hypothetical protein
LFAFDKSLWNSVIFVVGRGERRMREARDGRAEGERRKRESFFWRKVAMSDIFLIFVD